MATIPKDPQFYEWGNKMKVPIEGLEDSGPGGEDETAYLDHGAYGGEKKKLPYEADGEGSKGPAAR